MAVKLGNLLPKVLEKITSVRCENCKVRPKRGTDKFCKRCIDRYHRKQRMTAERADALALQLVEPLYANATLDDIEPGMRKKLLGREAEQDLFLFGLQGRGKTHIMAALIRHYIGQGYGCMRICFDDFCCQVRTTMSPASKMTEWDMIKPLKEVDMLFIDDLGLRSKPETDFAYGTLYSILNKRQERLLPTFVSSNKNLARLGVAFDERIVSRLRTALAIELVGVDRRKMPEILAEKKGGAK